LGQATLPSGYSFTQIAVSNTSQTLPNGIPPGINNSATVVYEVQQAGANSFFAANGSGAPTSLIPGSIAGPLGPLNDSPSINDAGFIGFIATSSVNGCPCTVYTTNGTVSNTLATGLQWSFSQILGGLNVPINNLGAVTFRAPSGNIIRADPNGTQTVIANLTGFISTGLPGSVNRSGTVAFAGEDANGRSGIFTSNGTTTTLIAHDGGIFGQVSGSGNNFPSINDSGVVGFAASNIPPNGVNGVFTNDGTIAGIITDNSAALAFSNVAINNSGTVAFIGGNGSSQAIFVGTPGVAPETVIQTGDSLAGSTVSSLVIGPDAINGTGQIAFWASLANGQAGIFRADPSAGVGTTADNPALPTAIDPNGAFNIPLGPCLTGLRCHDGDIYYVDPPANVAGYNYSVDPTSSPFDGVILPVGLGLGPNNNYYVLTLFNSHFKAYIPTLHVLTGGVPFHFATAGLANPNTFGILGVNPAAHLDPTNVTAFPTGLTFVPGPIVGNLQMAPVTYPKLVASH